MTVRRESFFLPRNLDLSKCPPDLTKYQEEAKYIVHCIFGRKAFHRELQDQEYVRLKMAYLREVVSDRRASRWMNWLISEGIIEVDPRGYVVGSFCKGYKMAKKYEFVGGIIVEVQDNRLNRKVAESRKRRTNIQAASYRRLEKCLREIEIDSEAAMDYVRQKKDYSAKKSPESARYCDESAITMIRDKMFFFAADNYGRVHHNISNLSHDLRQFLRWKGRRLVNTDTRNSQPLIFGSLLKVLLEMSEFESDSKEVQSLIKKAMKYSEEGLLQEKTERMYRISSAPQNCNEKQGSAARNEATTQAEVANSTQPATTTGGGERHSNTVSKSHSSEDFAITYAETKKTRAEVAKKVVLSDAEKGRVAAIGAKMIECSRLAKKGAEEVKRYVDLCCSGSLYEHFQGMVPQGSKYADMSRKEFKQAFFRECIFSKRRCGPDRLWRDMFKKEFPTIWKIVRLFKHAHHSVLPKLLQGLEGGFILKGAVPLFFKQRPKGFAVTIHDSMLVAPEDVEVAIQSIRESFAKKGITPTVAIEK